METLSWHHFLEGGLNPERYLQLLNDVLEMLVGELSLTIRHGYYLQQDGKPPHFAGEVRKLLDGVGAGDQFDNHQALKPLHVFCGVG